MGGAGAAFMAAALRAGGATRGTGARAGGAPTERAWALGAALVARPASGAPLAWPPHAVPRRPSPAQLASLHGLALVP